jgi:ribosome-associated translation inhibitor RaiA
MLINVRTDNHIQGREELVDQITTAVESSFRRFEPQLTRAEVYLADENAHKTGDNDKRCTIEVHLSGLQPIVATASGGNLDQAFDGALDKLVSSLDHKLGRLGERKGRTSYSGETAD